MKLRELLPALTSPQFREQLRYRKARRIVERHGYVYADHMVWKDQPFFIEARKRATSIAGIPDPRSFVLQSAIRSLANIDGAVAECGVRQGRSSIFMLTADTVKRPYHLFDSFAGLSEPTENDQDNSGRTWWKAGDLSTEEEVTRRNLAGFDNVIFHVGWIPERFGEVAGERFALVHIDVDLYQPTIDALRFFHDRVAPHGMVISDDYGSGRCPGAREAFNEFYAGRPEGIVELPTGQAFVIKRP
jgi:hypothetical protein